MVAKKSVKEKIVENKTTKPVNGEGHCPASIVKSNVESMFTCVEMFLKCSESLSNSFLSYMNALYAGSTKNSHGLLNCSDISDATHAHEKWFSEHTNSLVNEWMNAVDAISGCHRDTNSHVIDKITENINKVASLCNKKDK